MNPQVLTATWAIQQIHDGAIKGESDVKTELKEDCFYAMKAYFVLMNANYRETSPPASQEMYSIGLITRVHHAHMYNAWRTMTMWNLDEMLICNRSWMGRKNFKIVAKKNNSSKKKCNSWKKMQLSPNRNATLKKKGFFLQLWKKVIFFFATLKKKVAFFATLKIKVAIFATL